MIDKEGYRANVGIIVVNDARQVLWAKRVRNKNAWQFPQGGVNRLETVEQTMFRELKEEIGLDPEHVEILGQTKRWLRYKLPKHLMRENSKPLCIGQKQKWFLLKLVADDSAINLDASPKPEFNE
ncbi:MAG: RNA pyrophosphohydrolase, partial [Gammaproteobacteria bacterium]|nr:RNA pyrophosphohydrolase [Gammaproteobacteria bacterium]